MSEESIKKALQEAKISTTITCPQAFDIAKKAKVPQSEIGRYCTEHGIKIRNCQLGCFK